MSLVINTNISSLNTQNNLSKSGNTLATATERLSSGLKINSAADNAAGFAISQRYTTQIGGLAQASSNASDAINLTQTAGSALDQVTSNLQAIRDLAAQSANGTYSDQDRATIDKEVQQRLAEVTRIANQTTFNGKKVLDGSLATQSFQVGADVGQTISVSLGTGVKASQLGAIAQTSSGDISSKFASAAGLTLAAGDLTVNGTAVTGNFSDAAGLATAINTAAGSTLASVSGNELAFDNSGASAVTFAGSKASSLGLGTVNAKAADTTTPGSASSSAIATAFPSDVGSKVVAAGDLKVGATAVAATTYTSASSLAAAINAAYQTDSGTAGNIATYNAASGEIDFSNTGSTAVSITATAATDSASLGLPTSIAAQTTTTGADGTGASTGVNTAVTAAATSALTLAAGDLTVDGNQITGTFGSVQDLSDAINAANTGTSAAVSQDGKGLNLYSATDITVTTANSLAGSGLANASSAASASNSLQGSDVKNVDDANALISRIDVALGSVADFAAQLGAVQNRFQSTISTLSSQSTNLQSAQSTIQDADFAAETANLSKAQVLQQAGISVLAQANSNPQKVLKLLQ